MKFALFMIIILSVPAFAAQKYKFTDPHLNDEWNNNYKEHSFPNIVYGSASSMTITNLSVTNLTASSINSPALQAFPETTIAVNTTYTNVDLWIPKGNLITINAGATLTLVASNIHAGLYQIFNCVGSGKVVFNYSGGTNQPTVYPEWWGATGDGTTDDITPINAAISSFPDGWGRVVFSGKEYVVSSTITISNPHMLLEGTIPTWRPVPPQIISTSNSSAIIMITGTTSGGDADGSNDGPQINNISFTRSGNGGANSKTIIVQNAVHAGFYNCSWGGSQYGMYVKNVGGLYLTKCGAYPGTDNNGSVYGVYIDGTTQGTVGVEVHEYAYSSNVETDTVYAFYDNETGGTGKGLGDRRIFDVAASGEIDYGIYMVDNSGFSSDVIIQNISFDNIQVAGVTLISPTPVYFQQAAIQTGWLNLAAASAVGVRIIGRQNTNVSNMTIAASATSQTGIKFEGSNYGTIMQNNFTGSSAFGSIITLTSSGTNKSDVTSVIGNTANVGGSIALVAVSSSVITGNTVPGNTITLDAASAVNNISNNYSSSISDSGSSNGTLLVDTSGRLVYYGDVIASHSGLAIAGTSNQVNVSLGAGGATLSLPQDITNTSSVTFSTVTATTLVTVGNGANKITTSSGIFTTVVSSLTSPTANPATAGIVRLANTDVIYWRNAANSANIDLTVDSSNRLVYSGNVIGSASGLGIIGTANQINTSFGAGGTTLSTPQDIGTASSPTFSQANLTYLNSSSGTITGNFTIRGVVTATGTINLGGPGNSVTIASTTILSGATFYAGNPVNITTVTFAVGTGLTGVTDGSTAPTGDWGEVVSSAAPATNAPTTDQQGDLVSITLSAGEWEITGGLYWTQNGSTWSRGDIGISTTTGNSIAGLTLGDNRFGNLFASSATTPTAFPLFVHPYIVRPTGSTVYYLKYRSTYTGGPPQAAGRLSARRVR